MKLCMIAAIGMNRELGKKGDLIWHIPEDLKYFKSKTMGAPVVMGKNTFNSLPKLLPGRKHIILSDDDNFNKDVSEAKVVHTKEELMEYINSELQHLEKVFIIGGASMYKMFIDICDQMYLTHINAEEKAADVFFPEINKNEWDKKLEYDCYENGILIEHYEYNRR